MATTSNLVQALQQMTSNNLNQQAPNNNAPQLNMQSPVLPQQTDQSSWVQDMIDQHSNDGGRIKRTPVGFNFQSIPFDPSSFYRALDTSKSVQELATQVTQTEAANHQAAILAAQQAADAAKAGAALGGVSPNYTGGNGGITSVGGGNFNPNGVVYKYHLGKVAPDVAKAAQYFGGKYGIKTIYGVGPGSVPGSDHPHGLADDFMVYGNKKKGDALASDAIKNYKAWNIKYVIWYDYIWHPGRGWSKYSGPSNHEDHVHVSFNS